MNDYIDYVLEINELAANVNHCNELCWIDYIWRNDIYVSRYKNLADKIKRISQLVEHCSKGMSYPINLRMRKELLYAEEVLSKAWGLKKILERQ